jgi:hypothetical protein
VTIKIYVNADACPVKQGIYRVAERRALKGVALKVLVVSDSKLGWAKPRGGEPTSSLSTTGRRAGFASLSPPYDCQRRRKQNRMPLFLAARLLNAA